MPLAAGPATAANAAPTAPAARFDSGVDRAFFEALLGDMMRYRGWDAHDESEQHMNDTFYMVSGQEVRTTVHWDPVAMSERKLPRAHVVKQRIRVLDFRSSKDTFDVRVSLAAE